MAFLSAPSPWQNLVASFAEDLEQQVKLAHPDLDDLVIGVRGQEVVVVVPAAASDPESAAWRIACELGALWDGFLGLAEVGFRVVAGPIAISVPSTGMLPDPAAQGQTAWLEGSTISLV